VAVRRLITYADECERLLVMITGHPGSVAWAGNGAGWRFSTPKGHRFLSNRVSVAPGRRKEKQTTQRL